MNSGVDPPTCGVIMQLGADHNGCPTGNGSGSVTSTTARMRSCRNASTGLIRVARHASLDVAQRLRPGQLGKQHGHQMALAVEPSRVGIGFQLRDQSLEVVPRNMLRHGMHHAILVRHGIALFVSGNVANVQTRVESMSCASHSKILAGQPWAKPGHPRLSSDRCYEVVDGRHKAGHDMRGWPPSSDGEIYSPWPDSVRVFAQPAAPTTMGCGWRRSSPWW